MYRGREITRDESKRREYNKLRVVFTFPNDEVMHDFLTYMSDGGVNE